MINKMALENFTVFQDLKIEFSNKINIIIGENGTGKSHLLKAAYSLCSSSNKLNDKVNVTDDDIQDAITSKLLKVFMPFDDKLGKLRRQGAEQSEKSTLSASFIFDKQISTSFHSNSKSVAIQRNAEYERYSWKPVFVPTKEVLSFMKGFTSLYEQFGLSFDQTYFDICSLLDLPEIRPENLKEKSKWAMSEIENVCGGRFVFYGGGKVTFKTDTAEYSANSMAEGFRKAGMLSRLLETGAIQPGASGPLFWDEPESNMNPKLMKLLVEILLELSRNGQQIVIATHDYVLLKWFDLLIDKKGKEDHIRFHSLYRENGQVKIESVDEYSLVRKSAISDSFAELYDADLERVLG